MSNINTTLINSMQKIEVVIVEIDQSLRELQKQFSKQFSKQFVQTVSAKDLNTMQQIIIEQSEQTLVVLN
ncbi:hypothetical protein PHYBLDRAFT_147290 [Phycomyces blakesleeanus NRRL 1555(-)]|uniref:Uncharacterized protein n=1 Tax=Phycomyces blakesleeanus (strain ATCC 8743b / DSM 1359 / FGSC 10004 / NBRC 33097 / NRRL 1555) TaxID=763407 RepID=A0A167M1Y1_PHYB8|nr:hypothetical protein PHYBLDRAFT_147290 [Phycomyces blakesleeanus NRRL 1555(-)]OAD71544.1 hypothetical protein PHYBLDRAFT_147290 [Phycomyces blakesleeanus NRRL 1555(-)]|eukprot:XP_018289584.1 hypothetical protein PHYBLDRAFT_147290 [Phycomyces blakesleeanus NRRL 1555(-)]